MGVPHPDHLEQVLTPRQINDWALFWEVEPWGTPADDQRAAQTTWATLLPHLKDKGKTPDDYLIRWGPREPMTVAEQIAKAKIVLARAAPRS